MDETTTLCAGLDERLRSVERRVRDLATVFDPLVDVRAAAEQPLLGMEQLLAALQALTAQMRARENSAEWDAIDHLAARIMLQVLSQIAAELRRGFNQRAAQIETARAELHRARRALDTLDRELSSPDSPPAVSG